MSPSTPFLWTPECQTAFGTLKFSALSSDDMLLYPDFQKHFLLACDASDISIGCALMQKDESGTLRPIAYSGRSLKPAETRYTILDRELLAIVFAVKHFRVYLESTKFTVYTDHAALKFLMTQKQLLQCLARWQIVLNNFDFDIVHISGSTNNIADALSRRDYAFNTT